MAIIFINGERKYIFRIGYVVKIGLNFYRIKGIEELRWYEPIGSIATVTVTQKDFDTYMKPLAGYIYWVEYMGIDGFCGFSIEFPKGIVHGAPRGQLQYIYKDEAGKLNPVYYPMIITAGSHPTWNVYNPTGAANNSDAYFFGERWKVDLLKEAEIAEITSWEELTDYASSGIGQG